MLGFSQILTNTVYLEGEGKIEYLHLAQRRERERERERYLGPPKPICPQWVDRGRETS
jgi:hypothetical protein